MESPETMTHVERYHGSPPSVYIKLESSLPTETPQDILQMAVKCVNDSVGPDELCSTLLIFDSLPRSARNSLTPTQIHRARSIEDSMNSIKKIQSRGRVEFSLKHRGPYGHERFDLDGLFPGSLALVC